MLGWILLAGLAGAALYGVWLYNNLVRLRNRFRNAFAQIDVQLKRRYELIPNLVHVAKRYLEHEQQTLENVTQARNVAQGALRAAGADPGNALAMKELGRAEAAVGGALGRLLAVAESYPELKANETMMQLSEELSSTENRVAFARQSYNDAVMHFNTACETFPSTIVAGSFSFRRAELLELENEAARTAPVVDFS